LTGHVAHMEEMRKTFWLRNLKGRSLNLGGGNNIKIRLRGDKWFELAHDILGNQYSGSLKTGKYWLNDYQLLKENPAPFS